MKKYGIASAIANNPRKRTFAKTVTWRILATILTAIVVFAYTGELNDTSKITLTAAVILTMFYYVHEKFWLWLRN